MEFQGWKVVFTGSVKKIHGFDGLFWEQRSDIIMFLSNFAAKSNNVMNSEAGSSISWKGDRLFFRFNHVEVLDSIQRGIDAFQSFLALISWKIGFKNFFFIHKEIGKDLIHIHSTYIVVVSLVYHVDEIHSFLVETEQTQPFFVVHMFILHLLDQVGKQ